MAEKAAKFIKSSQELIREKNYSEALSDLDIAASF